MNLLVVALVLSWIITGLASWLAYQLLLERGRLLLRVEDLEPRTEDLRARAALEAAFPPGLPIGSVLPDFELPDLRGDRRALSQWRGRRVLLIFFDPCCGFCRAMLPYLAALSPNPPDSHPVPLIVTAGDAQENRRLFPAHGCRIPVLLQDNLEVASLCRICGTPMGYLVDEQGMTASPLTVGGDALLALVGTSPPELEPEALAVGTSATLPMSDSRQERTPYPRTAVLLTTWNRPRLLRQSLPQIEREAMRIGAQLVICDDQSDDEETLALLEEAKERGIEVIRRDPVRSRDLHIDSYIHSHLAFVFDCLVKTCPNAGTVPRASDGRVLPAAEIVRTRWMWDMARRTAHAGTQQNNLFAFRYVLETYARAEFILKVDDDIVLAEGAFAQMLEVWERATRDGHDVLVCSGLATIHDVVLRRLNGYAVTTGACAAAILYRRADWEVYAANFERQIIEIAFDSAFLWRYAPAYRNGAVCITVSPSVVYHTGTNGVHEHLNVNRDFCGSLKGVVTE